MRSFIAPFLLVSAGAIAAQQHHLPDTASTKKGMVVTCQALAGQAGIDILRRGGNAADAYIATTLAEYVTAFGYTSISGPIGLLYYDSKSNTSQYLNAALNKVSDPKAQFEKTTPVSGRAYVIGGAAWGLESLFQRFGGKRLTFADLAAPSVKLAHDGFTVYSSFAESKPSLAHSRRIYFDAKSRILGFMQLWPYCLISPLLFSQRAIA